MKLNKPKFNNYTEMLPFPLCHSECLSPRHTHAAGWSVLIRHEQVTTGLTVVEPSALPNTEVGVTYTVYAPALHSLVMKKLPLAIVH